MVGGSTRRNSLSCELNNFCTLLYFNSTNKQKSVSKNVHSFIAVLYTAAPNGNRRMDNYTMVCIHGMELSTLCTHWLPTTWMDFTDAMLSKLKPRTREHTR